MFLTFEIFWGGRSPEILDRRYKIGRSFDHRAKFHAGRLFNVGLTVLDNAVYRFSISLSSPKIFAVKLESCRKTH